MACSITPTVPCRNVAPSACATPASEPRSSTWACVGRRWKGKHPASHKASEYHFNTYFSEYHFNTYFSEYHFNTYFSEYHFNTYFSEYHFNTYFNTYRVSYPSHFYAPELLRVKQATMN